VRRAVPAWRLADFLDRFDDWAERENPSDDVRVVVIAWIMSRLDDPYQGVRREPDFDNLWYGVVPMSQDGAGSVVVCAYWIDESTRTVRCHDFGNFRP
jgi:hypothetical protein